MGDAARRLEPKEEVAHDFATVVELGDDHLTVESEWGRRTARRAPSCLLEPRLGDRVLVVERGPEAYVLSVLETDSKSARIDVDGDLELRVRAGRFVVVAEEGVELLTEKALSLLGAALKVRASEGEVIVDRLAYVGRELVGNARAAKLTVGALSSFVETLSQHVKRAYRTVEETEQLRAKRVDYRTEEELSLRGRHAFVHAAELVKVTGEQIHMG